jgi:polyisoprenoid-binding protein YceI
VPAQSEITFQVKQSGVPIDGRFRRFDAQLALDPKAPQGGSVTIGIDTASATVGLRRERCRAAAPAVVRQREVSARRFPLERDHRARRRPVSRPPASSTSRATRATSSFR